MNISLSLQTIHVYKVSANSIEIPVKAVIIQLNSSLIIIIIKNKKDVGIRIYLHVLPNYAWCNSVYYYIEVDRKHPGL